MAEDKVSPTPFRQFLQRLTEDGVAPGFQGVIFDRNGVLFDEAVGVRSLADKENNKPAKPMTTDTIHWIASCTKVAISIVLLRLLEQGAGDHFGLTLDTLDDHAALTRVLPEFKQDSGHNVTKILEGFSDQLDGDGKRTPFLRPANDSVTLRHLLTHSAGFAYSFVDSRVSTYFNPTDGSTPHASETSATGRIADFDVPKVHEAGEVYSYGHATDWLGQLIVRLAGVNLRRAMIEHLFVPLGISTDHIDLMRRRLVDDRQNDDVASFVVRDGKTQFAEIPLSMYEPAQDDPPTGHAHYASACLFSSLSTFARLLQAILTHDPTLLRESTWTLAEADNTTPYGVSMPYPNLKSYNPMLSCDIAHYLDFDTQHDSITTTADYTDTAGVNLLQAIVARKRTASGLQPGAYSWAGLGNTFWFIDPSQGIGAVLGTQLLPFCDPHLIAARNEWETLITSTTA